jgi:hypothetical protein
LKTEAIAHCKHILFFANAEKANAEKNKKSLSGNTQRQTVTDRQHDRKKTTPYNSTYPKGGVLCSKDSFVVNQTLVFQIKFCGKSPALRVAAKR